ncbi:MAG: plasmid recombination protein [Bacilli bacterium]|nr:plasmid recombination protein [Bacilli bacterium]
MVELSYSLHLSNDRNKSKKGRKTAKKNKTNTTSFSNNAIQNYQNLSKVDKHNLRKYDNDQDLIYTILGTSSIVEDTKNLYLILFERARKKYNDKQTRNDRKIDNYFNHISNDDKRDLACEIIIELGDMDFWSDKDDEFRKKMIDVFREQIDDLEELVPNFKIANATAHFDESSPHLHIVGVPFKEGLKNGMERQVGKSDVFTKTSLVNIQNKMREYCINSFNRIYNLDYSLKEKEEGRNVDINVANMNDYKKFKLEKENNKKKLEELNNKVNELEDKSNQIVDIIDNLKPTMINKNNFTISKDDLEEIKKYINQTKNTTINLKDANEINVILDKYDQDLLNHSIEIKNLEQKIKNRNNEIYRLKSNLESERDRVDELEDEVSRLEQTLNYFKELWNKFIEFLQNKFFSSNKYDDLIDELYQNDILDKKNMSIIENEYVEIHEKDDEFER